MKYLIDGISCNTPGYETLIKVVPIPVPLTTSRVVLTFKNQRVCIEVCRAWIRSTGGEKV